MSCTGKSVNCVDSEFRPYTWITARFQVSNNTLKSWAEKGLVPVLRFPSGKRLYSVPHLTALLGQVREVTAKEKIIYARVSSEKQRPDLERQVAELMTCYPDHLLLSDVASGINFRRRGLNTLLDRVLDGQVSEVVVMHRDRLARFGVDLIEHILGRAGTRLVVHRQGDAPDGTTELADDLLAVTTVFVASHNGRRAAENRRKRRRLAQESTADTTPTQEPDA